MLPFDGVAEALVVTYREPFLTSLFWYVTMLGDTGTIIVLTVIACMFFYATRQRRYIWTLATIVIGSMATTWLLKLLFAEPRPADPIALIFVDSYSFPSGHATASAALYGFLIYLLFKTGKKDARSIVAAVVLALVIAAVGFSRLYLGVHYPSDIIAGYAIGFVWIVIGIRLSQLRN